MRAPILGLMAMLASSTAAAASSRPAGFDLEALLDARGVRLVAVEFRPPAGNTPAPRPEWESYLRKYADQGFVSEVFEVATWPADAAPVTWIWDWRRRLAAQAERSVVDVGWAVRRYFDEEGLRVAVDARRADGKRLDQRLRDSVEAEMDRHGKLLVVLPRAGEGGKDFPNRLTPNCTLRVRSHRRGEIAMELRHHRSSRMLAKVTDVSVAKAVSALHARLRRAHAQMPAALMPTASPSSAGKPALSVSSELDGAVGELSGVGPDALVATLPATFSALEPGSYTLRVSKEGFAPRIEEIEIAAGGDRQVAVRLQENGSVEVTGGAHTARVELFDDRGELEFVTSMPERRPAVFQDVPPGRHRLVVSWGRKLYDDVVQVQPGEVASVSIPWVKRPKLRCGKGERPCGGDCVEVATHPFHHRRCRTVSKLLRKRAAGRVSPSPLVKASGHQAVSYSAWYAWRGGKDGKLVRTYSARGQRPDSPGGVEVADVDEELGAVTDFVLYCHEGKLRADTTGRTARQVAAFGKRKGVGWSDAPAARHDADLRTVDRHHGALVQAWQGRCDDGAER